MRLNYVVKPTVQPNVDSNVQRNENPNQSPIMKVNLQANVDPNVQPTMDVSVEEILYRMVPPPTNNPCFEVGETSKDKSSTLDNISLS